MDPLDPLTEIIKTGQSFSFSIALERILWIMMGFFFLGAISTSIIRRMLEQYLFRNRAFLASLKALKRKDHFSKKLNDEK